MNRNQQSFEVADFVSGYVLSFLSALPPFYTLWDKRRTETERFLFTMRAGLVIGVAAFYVDPDFAGSPAKVGGKKLAFARR